MLNPETPVALMVSRKVSVYVYVLCWLGSPIEVLEAPVKPMELLGFVDFLMDVIYVTWRLASICKLINTCTIVNTYGTVTT